MKAKRRTPTTEQPTKLEAIYVKEYDEKQYSEILAMLRKIDRLRQKWTAAQNELIR